MSRQAWFTTSLFQTLPDEDNQTNPGRLGAALAVWVRDKLRARGFSHVEEPIAEDWGWVVMVQRKPYRLWVGCGNEEGSTTRWSIFVEAEPSIFQKIVKRMDPTASVVSLEQELEEIIRSQPAITDFEWVSC